jgi:gamma-glutamylputrescine oxidase
MTISYWQAQAGLPGRDAPPTDRIEVETDLCIVGAGIIGAGAAQWAAQAGIQGVVVEAREAALGASGRNAGFVLTGVAASYYAAVRDYGREKARELWQISIGNVAQMLAWAQEYEIPTAKSGSLLLAESEQEADELRQSAEMLAEDGFPGDFTPYDPLNRGFFASLARPNDGVTQPALLSRAVLERSGFPLIAGSPVTRFSEKDGWVTVESHRATIRARQVLLCTNAWSESVHPYFVGKVIPMRGQIYISEPAPLVFETAGYSHYGYWYFRQVVEADQPGYGRWLMGGARHLHYDTENNNPSEATSDGVQSDLEAWTARHFPELSDVAVDRRWAGIMGFTADGLPLVGKLPGYERVGFSVGFNGHGMGLGVMVAKRAVELMVEGKDPGLFAASRLERV